MRPRDRHDRQVFRRNRRKRLEGRFYSVVAPEDFILQKLKVGRPRDFEDALSVLERSGPRPGPRLSSSMGQATRDIERTGVPRDPVSRAAGARLPRIPVEPSLALAISAIAVVLIGIYPRPLLDATLSVAASLF